MTYFAYKATDRLQWFKPSLHEVEVLVDVPVPHIVEEAAGTFCCKTLPKTASPSEWWKKSCICHQRTKTLDETAKVLFYAFNVVVCERWKAKLLVLGKHDFVLMPATLLLFNAFE